MSIKLKKYPTNDNELLSQSTVRWILSDMMQSQQQKLNTFPVAPLHVLSYELQTFCFYDFVFLGLGRPIYIDTFD